MSYAAPEHLARATAGRWLDSRAHTAGHVPGSKPQHGTTPGGWRRRLSFALESQLSVTTTETAAANNAAASPDDPYVVRMSDFVRMATDTRNSLFHGPSASTIKNYVDQGLLPALRDSTGRLLFRRSDAKRALAIYWARKRRHGAVGKRGFQRLSGTAGEHDTTTTAQPGRAHGRND